MGWDWMGRDGMGWDDTCFQRQSSTLKRITSYVTCGDDAYNYYNDCGISSHPRTMTNNSLRKNNDAVLSPNCQHDRQGMSYSFAPKGGDNPNGNHARIATNRRTASVHHILPNIYHKPGHLKHPETATQLKQPQERKRDRLGAWQQQHQYLALQRREQQQRRNTKCLALSNRHRSKC